MVWTYNVELCLAIVLDGEGKRLFQSTGWVLQGQESLMRPFARLSILCGEGDLKRRSRRQLDNGGTCGACNESGRCAVRGR